MEAPQLCEFQTHGWMRSKVKMRKRQERKEHKFSINRQTYFGTPYIIVRCFSFHFRWEIWWENFRQAVLNPTNMVGVSDRPGGEIFRAKRELGEITESTLFLRY